MKKGRRGRKEATCYKQETSYIVRIPERYVLPLKWKFKPGEKEKTPKLLLNVETNVCSSTLTLKLPGLEDIKTYTELLSELKPGEKKKKDELPCTSKRDRKKRGVTSSEEIEIKKEILQRENFLKNTEVIAKEFEEYVLKRRKDFSEVKEINTKIVENLKKRLELKENERKMS